MAASNKGQKSKKSNASGAQIEITLINESFSSQGSNILIFQKNVAENFVTEITAWKVISHLGLGDRHTFTYSLDVEIAMEDSYGNSSKLTTARAGERWNVVQTNTGDQLLLSEVPSASPLQIACTNDLPKGAINIVMYRDNALVGIRKNLVPNQKTVFQYRPQLYIGVVDKVEQGAVISPALLNENFIEISLVGFSRANLTLIGGGIGPSAEPYQFLLDPTA